MIPLKDRNPTRSRPWVTWAIIGANIWVFWHEWQILSGASYEYAGLEAFIERWGVVPYWIAVQPSIGSLVTPFTSMFIHGGVLHLLGNMWFLWIFGDNVEDELGRIRYLLFYLLSGLAAVAAQVVMDPRGRLPMVGASGAIAGVLAGYVLLHPRARILTLVPIFIFIQLIELPAYFFIFVWFFMQLVMAYFSIGNMHSGGVAFVAHVGGFLAGLILVKRFRKSDYRPVRWTNLG